MICLITGQYRIGHFRVHLSLHFKVRLSAKSLLWKSAFIHIEIGTNYHNKTFALRLALKERLRGTRKWPITFRLFFNMQVKTNFHMKDKHQDSLWKKRPKIIRKWSIMFWPPSGFVEFFGKHTTKVQICWPFTSSFKKAQQILTVQR